MEFPSGGSMTTKLHLHWIEGEVYAEFSHWGLFRLSDIFNKFYIRK